MAVVILSRAAQSALAHVHIFPGTTNSPRVQALLSSLRDLPFCTWTECLVFSVQSENIWLCCSFSVRKNISLALSSMTELSHTQTHTYSVYLQPPTYTQTILRRMLPHRFCSPPMWQCLPSNERSLFQSSCRQGVWPTSQVFRVPYMTGGPSRPHRWTGCKHRPHPINT